MMSNTIPVLVYGKGDAHVEAVIERLKPDFEVIKAYESIPQASYFLSNVMQNGMVDGHEFRKPLAIIMGGGFGDADHEKLSSCSIGLQQRLTWLRPKEFLPGAEVPPPATRPPTPEYVATRVRAGFDMYASEIRTGSGNGKTLWY